MANKSIEYFDVDRFLRENYANKTYDPTPKKRQEATSPRKIPLPSKVWKKTGKKHV